MTDESHHRDSSEHIAFPAISISSATTLEMCRNLRCSEDGLMALFIASYPKSGTTWTQAIVYHLLTKGRGELNHISDYSPFYEIDSTWDQTTKDIAECYQNNHRDLRCRVFNTHLYWTELPKGVNIRYIYIVRNARDVVVSFYNHLTKQQNEDQFHGTFLEFLKLWCDGRIVFGSWIEHLCNWMDAPTDAASKRADGASNLLFLRYEELKSNIREQLPKIAGHLGVELSGEEMDAVHELVSFVRMKENLHRYQPVSVPWVQGFSFLRKGNVGDHVHYFGEEEELLFQQMIKRKYASQDLPRWLTQLV